jgi:asparagine synthase (glutamine-hydrolysing)
MFAFALWDGRRRRLLLARDRFGQKPLFFRFDGQKLLFASEIKALLAALPNPPAPDLRALDEYLTLRFVPSPRTLFQGIAKLPPAHVLVLDAAGVSLALGDGPLAAVPKVDVRRYWQLSYLPKRAGREADLVAETRERIRAAVESHMMSDVPVGAYLSGGMDSSLVTAVMAAAAGAAGRAGGPDSTGSNRVPTFAIGVEHAGFDELPYARQVAEHCGTAHHEEMARPDMVQLLPNMVWHLDEPSDVIAACMWHSAALAARHVKVVLTGDGGDEIFAGYDRYSGFRWVSLYAALPEPVRRGLFGPALGLLRDRAAYKNLTQRARWLHQLSFHQGGRRYAEATAFFRFGQEGRDGLYTPEMARAVADDDPMEAIIQAFDSAVAGDDLDRMLQADVATRLTEHGLMLTDRMTMAHSIEGRSPFLDHRLAEYVATLPVSCKIHGSTLKWVMRQAAAPYLPELILRRPKQGFMFPLAAWIKGPLLPTLRHLLRHSAVVERGIFSGPAIERLLSEHLAERADHHVRLWMILNVEVWYRLFVLRESRADLAGLFGERLGSAA